MLNENDSVSVAELVEHRRAQAGAAPADGAAPAGFGDNDGLSARVAVSLDADLLVLLTNVGGLYTANPRADPDGARASPSWRASTTRRWRAPTAAPRAAPAAWRASWRRRGWRRAKGRRCSSRAAPSRACSSARWRARTSGTLIAVADAPHARASATSPWARATAARWWSTTARCARWSARRRRCCPSASSASRATFDKGDVVEIRDGSGRVHGRGLVNYAADACRKLAGRHSDDIDAILGWRGYDALITRDNLVMGAV